MLPWIMNNTLGTMSGMCSKLKFYFFSLLFPHRRTSISYSSPLHLLSLWRKEWISCLGHLGWEPRDAELCLFFLFSLKSSCQSNVCILPFAPPSMNFTGPGPKRRLAGGEVCLIWSWVWEPSYLYTLESHFLPLALSGKKVMSCSVSYSLFFF